MNSLLHLISRPWGVCEARELGLLVLFFGLVSRFRLVEARPNRENVMDCMAFLLNVLSHKCSLRFRICHDE